MEELGHKRVLACNQSETQFTPIESRKVGAKGRSATLVRKRLLMNIFSLNNMLVLLEKCSISCSVLLI